MKQPLYFTATVKLFGKDPAIDPENTDKNGLQPLVLSPLSGKSPRGINVVSGTSAEQVLRIEAGDCCAFRATELEVGDDNFNEDVPNRQFQYEMLMPLDKIKAIEQAIASPAFILITSKEKDQWTKVAVAEDGAQVAEEA